MANISTSNTNSIYKYTAQIVTTFENDDNPVTIEFIRFKSIIIDYNYDGFNFPLIYCNVNLPIEVQQKLAENQKSGTVVFTLQKYMENSDMPGLKMDVVNKQCIYFIPKDDEKITESIKITNPDKTDDLGDDVTIGLIVLDHINFIKSTGNFSIKKGSMSSILYYLLSGQDLCIEPLQYNTVVENFVLPPINSLSKIIRYLNNYSAFYDSRYRFFIDFDCTYLLSSSGKGVKKKGEECNLVKFIIKNAYDEANMEGMSFEIVDGMYNIQCSGTYSTISDSSDTSKSFSAIGGITSQGNITVQQTGTRSSDSPIKAKTTNIRLPNNNATLLTQLTTEAANNQILLSIAKNKIDGTIITPNREIHVDTSEVFGEKYSGIYILGRKREMYMREGEGFAMATIMSLKRLAGQ